MTGNGNGPKATFYLYLPELNRSLSAGLIPHQLKEAVIMLVPKNAKPVQCSESQSHQYCHILLKDTNRTFIYPALQLPPPSLLGLLDLLLRHLLSCFIHVVNQ